MRVDLHSHSSCSDGLDRPAELVRRMAEAGVDALALTDHDTLQGLPEARDEAARLGIELISGVEISADFAGQDDIHILALFVDESHEAFNARPARSDRRTAGRGGEDGAEADRGGLRPRSGWNPRRGGRRRLGPPAHRPRARPRRARELARRGLRPVPRARAPLVRAVREVAGLGRPAHGPRPAACPRSRTRSGTGMPRA